MQRLGPAFGGDEVVVVVFAENVGALGDSDTDGRLTDKFGAGLEAARVEVDLGDEDARVEAVAGQVFVINAGRGREVDFIVLVVKE